MDPLPSMQEKSGRGEPSKTQLTTMPEMNELNWKLKRYVQGVKRWFPKKKKTVEQTVLIFFYRQYLPTYLLPYSPGKLGGFRKGTGQFRREIFYLRIKNTLNIFGPVLKR